MDSTREDLQTEQTTKVRDLLVTRNGRKQRLSYQVVFGLAHRMWCVGDYAGAKKVFAELNTFSDRGPRAAIFLAHCHGMLGDYAACSMVLHNALPKDDYNDTAVRLHDAFVFWKVGLYLDVKQLLKSLALEHVELPSLSLILAELLLNTGARRQSAHFLRQAIQNDNPSGAIRLAADATLKRMENN